MQEVVAFTVRWPERVYSSLEELRHDFNNSKASWADTSFNLSAARVRSAHRSARQASIAGPTESGAPSSMAESGETCLKPLIAFLFIFFISLFIYLLVGLFDFPQPRLSDILGTVPKGVWLFHAPHTTRKNTCTDMCNKITIIITDNNIRRARLTVTTNQRERH